MDTDEFFIERCFQLALNGLGNVSPNPMVGCVIVKNDIVIAEGFHRKYGENHAERNAIESVTDDSLLDGATLYVNLEPCSHFGKTPPCCDLIIEKKIKRVVCSNTDPNPLVAGVGLKKLIRAGINLRIDVLQEKGYELNKRFFTFFTKKRPYIILKWAQTKDGFIDVERSSSSHNNWITNAPLKQLVHKWRAEESAILVGTNTVENDNPQLNVRLWNGKDPVRIVLDKSLRLNHSLHVFDGTTQTIVYTEKTALSQKNVEFVTIDFNNLLPNLLDNLYARNIQSLIVEGGGTVLDTFLRENQWDEIRLLVGDRYFENGLKAPNIPFSPIEKAKIQNDEFLFYRNVQEF